MNFIEFTIDFFEFPNLHTKQQARQPAIQPISFNLRAPDPGDPRGALRRNAFLAIFDIRFQTNDKSKCCSCFFVVLGSKDT